jgi:hypothetical protein
MKLNFRQGIVSYDTDSAGNPLFLRINGDFVDLVVRNTPTTFTIAHYDQNYLFTEPNTVTRAWGPFEEGEDYYLYWDVDLLTGELSSGYTTVQPVYLSQAPHPEIDLHWFDLTNTVMKVWSGESWVDRLRVFAAIYYNATTLIPYEQGKSQASIKSSTRLEGTTTKFNNVATPAGYPIFDGREPVVRYRSDNRPILVHTESPLVDQFSRLSNYRLSNIPFSGTATENIPLYSAVAFSGGSNTLGVSRYVNPELPSVGLSEYLSPIGMDASFTSHGYVTNPNWDWDVRGTQPAGSPVFVDASGSLTTASPQTVSTQRIGVIVDRHTIFVNVRPIIIFGREEFVWPTIVFDAGADQNVLCADTVQLEARIYVGNISNHTFEWEQLEGTPISLDNANTLTPSFDNPGTGDLVFRLWVDRNSPYEQFSDVSIFRILSSVTTLYYQPTAAISTQTVLEAGRPSSEARMLQNVRVEPTSYSNQTGTFIESTFD